MGDDTRGDDPRGDDPRGDDPRGDDPRGDDIRFNHKEPLPIEIKPLKIDYVQSV